MRRRQTLYGEPAASACISTANALPVLTPFARPRTLRGSPRRGGTHSSPSGSPLSPLSAGWAALLSPIASDTLALPTSPPPNGLPSSEPRSMRADVIPGSERRATFATRQRGKGGAPRRPGVGESRSPLVGRAAERARSAARASPGHPPAHSAPTPPDPLLAPFYPLSPPPSPLSSCRMGWRPRSRGACGQMLSPVRSGTPPTATRQRGGGARRVDRGERSALTPVGRAAEPARSAARASPGYPAADSAPALYPRAPLLPPPPAARQKTKKSSADPPGRTTL